MIVAAVITVAGTIGAAWIGLSDTTEDAYVVTGRVYEEQTGKPIAGATIFVEGNRKTMQGVTGDGGIYSVTFSQIPELFNISVHAEGYYPLLNRQLDPHLTTGAGTFNAALKPIGKSDPSSSKDWQDENPDTGNSMPKPAKTPANEFESSVPIKHEEVRINGFVRSDLEVLPGDRLVVKATGLISVGDFIGTVGPDGKATFGSAYNIVQRYPHGALLWRIDDDIWRLCGSKLDVVVQSKGTIEFEVNDREQSNNSEHDFFEVEVFIYRSAQTVSHSILTSTRE